MVVVVVRCCIDTLVLSRSDDGFQSRVAWFGRSILILTIGWETYWAWVTGAEMGEGVGRVTSERICVQKSGVCRVVSVRGDRLMDLLFAALLGNRGRYRKRFFKNELRGCKATSEAITVGCETTQMGRKIKIQFDLTRISHALPYTAFHTLRKENTCLLWGVAFAHVFAHTHVCYGELCLMFLWTMKCRNLTGRPLIGTFSHPLSRHNRVKYHLFGDNLRPRAVARKVAGTRRGARQLELLKEITRTL
jgi:hypothetical protein